MSKDFAADIYRRKIFLLDSLALSSLSRSVFKTESAKLARECRISARIVRDIWNHKSWVVSTERLWRDQPSRTCSY